MGVASSSVTCSGSTCKRLDRLVPGVGITFGLVLGDFLPGAFLGFGVASLATAVSDFFFVGLISSSSESLSPTRVEIKLYKQ